MLRGAPSCACPAGGFACAAPRHDHVFEGCRAGQHLAIYPLLDAARAENMRDPSNGAVAAFCVHELPAVTPDDVALLPLPARGAARAQRLVACFDRRHNSTWGLYENSSRGLGAIGLKPNARWWGAESPCKLKDAAATWVAEMRAVVGSPRAADDEWVTFLEDDVALSQGARGWGGRQLRAALTQVFAFASRREANLVALGWLHGGAGHAALRRCTRLRAWEHVEAWGNCSGSPSGSHAFAMPKWRMRQLTRAIDARCTAASTADCPAGLMGAKPTALATRQPTRWTALGCLRDPGLMGRLLSPCANDEPAMRCRAIYVTLRSERDVAEQTLGSARSEAEVARAYARLGAASVRAGLVVQSAKLKSLSLSSSLQVRTAGV